MILPNFPGSREYRKRQGSVKNEKAEYSFFPNSYGGNDPREGTCKPAAGILLSPAGSARKNPGCTPHPYAHPGRKNYRNPRNPDLFVDRNCLDACKWLMVDSVLFSSETFRNFPSLQGLPTSFFLKETV